LSSSLPFAVATVVFAAATASVVAIVSTAVAVAIDRQLLLTRSLLGFSLLSAVHFCHHMSSCNHQRSHCQPLLLPIIIHHCHRHATAGPLLLPPPP
jgi:hypothetical protein